MLMTLAIVLALLVTGFAGLGWWSSHGAAVTSGVIDNALTPCARAPNCVCSEASQQGDVQHYVAPLLLPERTRERTWATLRQAVQAAGGHIVAEHADYLHATFTSRLFHFVDDVEVRRDGDLLHFRSASRVGYSDLGANRARIDLLKARLQDALGG